MGDARVGWRSGWQTAVYLLMSGAPREPSATLRRRCGASATGTTSTLVGVPPPKRKLAVTSRAVGSRRFGFQAATSAE